MMEFASRQAITSILFPDGFSFSKAMGQNFLVDPRVPDRIAASIPEDIPVGAFEVGPGLGALTQRLSQKCVRTVAVELDHRLIGHLESCFPSYKVHIHEGDILKTDIQALVEKELTGLHPVCCANLPYYITSPAISALLEAHCFEQIIIMVQKEVAARIASRPATPDYSAFTVYCQWHSEVKTLFKVPSGCFFPAPKVDSAVIQLIPRKEPLFAVPSEKILFSLVRASFDMRRKTLSNSLASVAGGKEKALSLLAAAGIDPLRRGETLTLEEFATLANCYSAL